MTGRREQRELDPERICARVGSMEQQVYLFQDAARLNITPNKLHSDEAVSRARVRQKLNRTYELD